jgi:ferredoxin
VAYKTETENLKNYIDRWADRYSVYVPSESGELVPYEKGQEIAWHKVPVWGGIKDFVFPARSRVVGEESHPALEEKPIMLIGVRGCDLTALTEVLDKIFLEQEPVDTVYKKLRENLTLVSVDCREPAETCFCTAVGGSPYGMKGYDLNLSFLSGGEVLIDTGSEKGEELVEELSPGKAQKEELAKRDDLKDTSVREIKNNFKRDYKKDNFRQKIEENKDEKYWTEKAKDCMICGGCNFACPTCYCSLLDEVSDRKEIKKVLQWDGCQFKGYARVGGGGNPRTEKWERLRYRYLCKFRIMDEEFSIPGCTGCGRCITVCPADIDIRETIEGVL